MAPAVVDGNRGGGKRRIGECSHRDAHAFRFAFFGVEQRGSAYRTESKAESRTLVTRTYLFGGRARDAEGRRETRQGGEHAAGALLAGKAVADANAAWSAVDFNAKLAASAGCCSWHRLPRRIVDAVEAGPIASRYARACTRPRA